MVATNEQNIVPNRILVVDDDQDILDFVALSLQKQGYQTLTANNGLHAIDIVIQAKPNLVILDLNMPEMSGFEVIESIRDNLGLPSSRLPVIFLSAQDDETSKVRALDLGADDYLTKPIKVNEMLARVRAALRRISELNLLATLPPNPAEPGRNFKTGRLEVDLNARIVKVDGKEIRMTPTEYNLLEYFITNLGKVVTHRQILQKVWGEAYGTETEYLRTFVKQLRRKIEPDPARPVYLLTEPGVGYRLKV